MRFLLFLLLLCFSNINAQEYFNPIGGKSRALADVSVSLDDPWSAFNNQAALANVRKTSIAVFAENRFGLKELNGGALAFTFPASKSGTLALDLYVFNYSTIYSRQKIGLAYGMKLSKYFYGGLQLNLIRTYTEEYGARAVMCAEAGLLFPVSKSATFGVHIFNPTAARYNKSNNEMVPVIVNIGGQYKLDDRATLYAEAEHSTAFGYGIKTALEYSFNEHFAVRLGFRNKPTIGSFGLFLGFKSFNVDIAMQFHQILGSTPSLSAYHYFGENKQ